ncbi:HlyD family secretion protein [Prevotella sp. KH2C16]|uniref:HlyD family secretion protein n=1 Tax=Prevotella sp. KH2C16 TaxID=1855325 RepID=UPI0008F09064|nr:HlyD family efflux transporter periplasmic adaptor subunit [Prevotella sp. KH2C16]SFF85291.1 HlyD family secretion protein [Prevotella sp. KH2C16]
MKILKNAIVMIFAAIIPVACDNEEKGNFASGTFEATEITVSAEQTGKLLRLDITEGDKVEAGTQVGLIDTVQLYLRARQVGATKIVYESQKPEAHKQVAATTQQIKKAREDVNRYAQLVKEGAANRKLLDDARSQLQVLQRQLEAQTSALNTSTKSLNAQMGTADVERLQIADQLLKCHIHAPITGIVLEKYAEAGEFATTGKPLFKVADIDHMYLRAYITTAQLKQVRIGQTAKVFADYGNGDRKEYRGTVTWISSKSEFTPKTILTDDERADLVYAMKVAVKNDGYIKIGMYGSVEVRTAE